MDNKTIAVMIAYKDRPTEIFGLLQSLRTQTHQNFDIFIRDDMSGTPLTHYHFLNCMFTRLRCEGHQIFIKKNEFTYGVSRNRQALVDDVFKRGDYQLLARYDDDVLLEPDYQERLLKVLKKGYDIASGVTIPMQVPTFSREPKHLKGIVNRVILDNKGNYILNGDDCGMAYTESVILPAHHFRSCAVCYMKVHEKSKILSNKTKYAWIQRRTDI